MKVILEKQILVGNVNHYRGNVVDVDEQRAKRLIQGGVAKPYIEDKPNCTINATVNGESIEVEIMTEDRSEAVQMVEPKRKRRTKKTTEE